MEILLNHVYIALLFLIEWCIIWGPYNWIASVLISLAQMVGTVYKICKLRGSNLDHHQKRIASDLLLCLMSASCLHCTFVLLSFIELFTKFMQNSNYLYQSSIVPNTPFRYNNIVIIFWLIIGWWRRKAAEERVWGNKDVGKVDRVVEKSDRGESVRKQKQIISLLFFLFWVDKLIYYLLLPHGCHISGV